MTSPTLLQKHEALDRLQAFVDTFDTRKLAADKLKCTEAQLSTTINGKTDVIPARILKSLKMKSIVVYVTDDDAKLLGRKTEKPATTKPAKKVAKKVTSTKKAPVAKKAATPKRRKTDKPRPSAPIVMNEGLPPAEVANRTRAWAEVTAADPPAAITTRGESSTISIRD